MDQPASEPPVVEQPAPESAAADPADSATGRGQLAGRARSDAGDWARSLAEADAQLRRPGEEARLRERSQRALETAGTVLDQVTGLVRTLRREAFGTPAGASTLTALRDELTRRQALHTALHVDWDAVLHADGAVPDPDQLAAAVGQVRQALEDLDAGGDEVHHGFEDLLADLGRLRQAVRDAERHVADRPLSRDHLRMLLAGTARIANAAAVGVLAATAATLSDGWPGMAAVIAAAISSAVTLLCEQLTALIRRRVGAPDGGRRLVRAHHDLVELVRDFSGVLARVRAADHPPEPSDVRWLEKSHAVGLLFAYQAAGLARDLDWTSGPDYARTTVTVAGTLTAAVTAAQAGDAAGVALASEAVQWAAGEVGHVHIPAGLRPLPLPG